MTPVTDDEFEALLATGFGREAIHLETRDAYGTEAELPHMAQWARGEPMTWVASGLVRYVARARQRREVRAPGADRVRAAQRLPALVLQHRLPHGGRW